MQPNVAFLATDIGRLFRKRFESASRSAGVTGPQWRLLLAIERQPGATQIALANLLEVEPITAGRMIDRLARAGMVERRSDPADRRAWRLHLTDNARPEIVDARARADSLIERALVGISEAERAQLAALLERMRENLTSADAACEPKVTAHG
ncbi:MAG: MarR family transcriptional regulator [Novosphingobium sp.]